MDEGDRETYARIGIKTVKEKQDRSLYTERKEDAFKRESGKRNEKKNKGTKKYSENVYYAVNNVSSYVQGTYSTDY